MPAVATIGLEVHAQLRTQTKMFCGCPIDPDAPPNHTVCPTCLGHPGTLPRPNAEAVALALRAGLALNCQIHPTSLFARKHYFYPDLPKGYQISQYDRPLCTGGTLHAKVDGQIRAFALTRIHLEEDAGRMHHGALGSVVDWNRGGAPLIEVVGEPDVGTPEAAEAWLRSLHRVLVHAGICGGDLELGQLRCDANVSINGPDGQPGTRVEIKNVNSFRFVARALRAEIQRQTALLARGERVARETRTWTGHGTAPLRDKEAAADYRYFPEPDLPPLTVSEADLAAARAALPGAPLDLWLMEQDAASLADFTARYGLGEDAAAVLLADPEVADFYAACIKAGADPRDAAAWVMGDVLRLLKEADGGLRQAKLQPAALVTLSQEVSAGRLSRAIARELLEEVFRTGADPAALVAERGLGAVDDEALLAAQAAAVVAAHPAEASRYREGKTALLGFFVGQTMRALDGRADPRRVSALVRAALERP